jgi:hypothetical protein
VSTAHFVPSMVAMIVFYFSSAPMMHKIVGFNPLTPERIAERRAAVLDFISAGLFLHDAKASTSASPRPSTSPGHSSSRPSSGRLSSSQGARS